MKLPFNKLPKDLQDKVRKLTQQVKRDMPIVIGKTATDHFRENFRKEGFVNKGLHKWKDVKRRDTSSKWYGFDYSGEKRTSIAITRDKKTGKTKRAKEQRKLNFSLAGTKRKPLSSGRMELHNSIHYKTRNGSIAIISDKEYAQVQNEGGIIKVFGKHSVKLAPRQFIGESQELNDKVEQEIGKRMKKIFEQNF